MDTTAVASHCPYCGLQCAMRLRPETGSAGGATVSVSGRQFPTNRGGLCHKGWTAAALLDSPHRLTTPLVRERGELRPVSWPEALDRVVAGIVTAQGKQGADGVAVFGGGGLTNEKAYALGKFARVALGTSQIDYNGRFCMSSAAAAGQRAFGIDRGLPFPLTDLDDADVVVIVGANMAETMPPLMQHLDGAATIVVDPRRTATAESAKLHLQAWPGTDLVLALGILHAAVIGGRLDNAYVARRTTGFEQLWRIAAHWYPERAERICGVAAADQHRVAELLATARNAYILTARGAEQHADGTDTVSAWINLALALGLPGKRGSGFGTVTGQGNGQGGREHGQKADQLPGYRKITDPAAREHVARVWGVEPETLPTQGRSAYELLESLGTDSGPSALLVFASNPVVSAPRAAHITERLSTVDTLVVCDFVLSETAAMADVVLPVTQWAEETGTMTNLEGRILLRQKAIDPPVGVRGDLEVLAELAARLGQPDGRFRTDPREVFDELRAASAGGPADYAGVTYERLRAGEALHWPVRSVEHPGTPRLFLDRFATDDGRARFVPVRPRAIAEEPDRRFPLQAITGRVLRHYQSGAQTRRIGELNDAEPEMYVEIHPDTALTAGLADRQTAEVSSRRGTVVATVHCVESMRRNVVFLPFHFSGEARANLVTNPALDPVSKMPEFKLCAVRIAALPTETATTEVSG